MIRTIDFYILGRVATHVLVMIGIALFALLLERLLRLLELSGNPDHILVYISQMLVMLIPHYLSIAIPAAYFLAVLLTFGRLQQDNELSVMMSAGIGLHRLIVPVTVLGAILVVLAGLISSYLQPFSRYAYRSLIHEVENASLNAAVKEGTFIHFRDMTFFADQFNNLSGRLEKVFVHEEIDVKTFATTASGGTLREAVGVPGSILILNDGMRVTFREDSSTESVILFDDLSWPIGGESEGDFRTRGKDERELTLPELWSARDAPPQGATIEEVVSEIHARLVRIATILVLPLLAIPLAMMGGSGNRTYSIATGVIILVIFEESLQFGEALISLGQVSVWLGIWLPFSIFFVLSAGLSLRLVFSRQPFGDDMRGTFNFSSRIFEAFKFRRYTT